MAGLFVCTTRISLLCRLISFFLFLFLCVHFNYRFFSVCVRERFLVTKCQEARARHRKIIWSQFTANNKHSRMADRHYNFRCCLFLFLSLVSPFLFVVLSGLVCPFVSSFHTFHIHSFVFVYFLQHNSLVLQFLFFSHFVCCVDVYDYIWWVGDHKVEEGKKQKQKENAEPANKQIAQDERYTE